MNPLPHQTSINFIKFHLARTSDGIGKVHRTRYRPKHRIKFQAPRGISQSRLMIALPRNSTANLRVKRCPLHITALGLRCTSLHCLRRPASSPIRKVGWLFVVQADGLRRNLIELAQQADHPSAVGPNMAQQPPDQPRDSALLYSCHVIPQNKCNRL